MLEYANPQRRWNRRQHFKASMCDAMQFSKDGTLRRLLPIADTALLSDTDKKFRKALSSFSRP
ncbi:hypothetical protein GCM10007863_34170 [Dyella mobilis]|nr:hypothetical protein GCM10007863_34170 [Dyella mobilis]